MVITLRIVILLKKFKLVFINLLRAIKEIIIHDLIKTIL